MELAKTKVQRACACLSAKLATMREDGQGTTEYAILVGVLAVIAMLAISAFKGKVTELWSAITSGISGL